MKDSLIHKNVNNKESLISPDPQHNKKYVCSLKCCALTGLSLLCIASISGLIYVNIVCGNFTDEHCDINHHCPNFSQCDSSSGL